MADDDVVLNDDWCLEWLWRYRFAEDGRRAHCRHCGVDHPFHRLRQRNAYVCDYCGRQIYPTAGTPMARSRSGLSTWFVAALLLSENPLCPAARLGKILGLSDRAAAHMRSRIVDAAGGDAQLIGAMAEAAAAFEAPVAVQPPRKANESDRSRTQSRQTRQQRDRILSAACRTIARRGLDTTRIADIAREAGVSTGIVHYYFVTKQDLLLAALEWSGTHLNRELDQNGRRDLSDIERVAHLVRVLAPDSRRFGDDYLLWLEMWVRVRNHPALLATCDSLSVRWHQHIAEVIRDGAARGSFSPVSEPETIAERFIGLANGLSIKAVLGYQSMPASRVRRLLVQFIAEQLQIAEEALA